MAASPFEFQGRTPHVCASAGSALHPADRLAAESLLLCADKAMHQAKTAGGGQFRHPADKDTA